LGNADLINANFFKANLEGVIFLNSNLKDADFNCAINMSEELKDYALDQGAKNIPVGFQ
jgi:uncharacterized protein YjbI with pentapeptide repeats